MKLPLQVEGALFGALLVPVTLFLKIICPVRVGCFADPFLVTLFSPLIILGWIFRGKEIPAGWEIIFLIFFWSAIWASLTYLYSNIFHRKVRIEPMKDL